MKTLQLSIMAIAVAVGIVTTLPNAFAEETAKPRLCCGQPFNTGLHPLDLWNEFEIIMDGTVIGIDNHTEPYKYHINANTFFKSDHDFSLISAIGNADLLLGDRALFYISKFNGIYWLSPYSITVTQECGARDLIPLSTLPNEPIGRGGPTLEFLIDHPCKPSYFKSRVSPLQQFKSGIKAEDVKCKQGLELILKVKDESPACVRPDHRFVLSQRGWGSMDLLFYKSALKTAKQFVLNSTTFKFDGVEDSLNLRIIAVRESLPPIITVQADFSSLHLGYGDRTRQNITNEITNHIMWIGINNQTNVFSAVIDEKWDEINQKLLE